MINKISARELQPKNPFFWNGVAKEKPSEIEGSFSSRDSQPMLALNKADSSDSSSISLSNPLTFEITEDHDNDLLGHITEDDIQKLRDDGEIANRKLIPSIGLLTNSILYSNIGDHNKEKLCSALSTIKLGLFSQNESQRPLNQDFLESLIILKNNLPKIIGSRANYTHVIVADIKKLVELAMKALEEKLQPA